MSTPPNTPRKHHEKEGGKNPKARGWGGEL